MKTASYEKSPRAAVLGLGNVLVEDDALGPHVIFDLQTRFTFPDGVVVQDLGKPGLDLAPFIMDVPAIILVDTVLSDAPAGSLELYRLDEILSRCTRWSSGSSSCSARDGGSLRVSARPEETST